MCIVTILMQQESKGLNVEVANGEGGDGKQNGPNNVLESNVNALYHSLIVSCYYVPCQLKFLSVELNEVIMSYYCRDGNERSRDYA